MHTLPAELLGHPGIWYLNVDYIGTFYTSPQQPVREECKSSWFNCQSVVNVLDLRANVFKLFIIYICRCLVYYIYFISLYGYRVLWCQFCLDPLFVCNSAVCDMELQFPWGSLPKGLIMLSKFMSKISTPVLKNRKPVLTTHSGLIFCFCLFFLIATCC